MKSQGLLNRKTRFAGCLSFRALCARGLSLEVITMLQKPHELFEITYVYMYFPRKGHILPEFLKGFHDL